MPSEGSVREGVVFTLMKNCEPPEFGRPVFAMEGVPGSLEISCVSSSGMEPPTFRVTVEPSA
eukprot:2641847-Lingulodinium_polyedra.AAC.1